MQYSLNHDLGLMEANDNVRRIDLVNNFEAIDNGLSPFYVAEKTEANTYKIITGASKTGLNNGYSVRIAIPSDSNGAVSIVVDTVKIPVKKPNGNVVTNFKANGVYSLTYYNSVFILASGGIDDVAFTSDKLLTGFSANDSNGEKIDGTMPNHGNITQALSLNGNITLPSGYYDSIKVNQSITARGAITSGHSVFKNGDILYCRIPQGAYFTNATSGSPEISYHQSVMTNALGLTPDMIVNGTTIGGITGTATVGSMAKSVAVENGTVVPYTNADGVDEFKITVGFRPRFAMVKYFHSTYNATTWMLFNYTGNQYFGMGKRSNNSTTSTYSTSSVMETMRFVDDGVIVKANPYYDREVDWIISQ